MTTEDKAPEIQVELEQPGIGTVVQPPSPEPEAQEPAHRADAEPDDDQDEPGTDEATERKNARRRRLRMERQRELDDLRARDARNAEIIESMNARLEQLAQHTQGSQAATLQEKYRQAQTAYEQAYESGNGERLRQANEDLMIARLNVEGAARQRPQPRQTPQRQQEQRQPPPNPYQQDWVSKNNWFSDPERSEDAAIAGAISETLLNEGYAANDPEHFRELDRRLKRRGIVVSKPSGHQPPPQRVASGQRDSLAPNKGKVVISARMQEHAEKFGFDLKDPKVAQRIASRMQSLQR